MMTSIVAFCIIMVMANSLAAPSIQKFAIGDSPQLPDGGTGISPRKGKREPGVISVPQSELNFDEEKDPDMQKYFRQLPDGGTGIRPRKGKRVTDIIPQSELSFDDEKGGMRSEFDQKANAIEKKLQDSRVSGNTKTSWEDFVEAFNM